MHILCQTLHYGWEYKNKSTLHLQDLVAANLTREKWQEGRGRDSWKGREDDSSKEDNMRKSPEEKAQHTQEIEVDQVSRKMGAGGGAGVKVAK